MGWSVFVCMQARNSIDLYLIVECILIPPFDAIAIFHLLKLLIIFKSIEPIHLKSSVLGSPPPPAPNTAFYSLQIANFANRLNSRGTHIANNAAESIQLITPEIAIKNCIHCHHSSYHQRRNNTKRYPPLPPNPSNQIKRINYSWHRNQ